VSVHPCSRSFGPNRTHGLVGRETCHWRVLACGSFEVRVIAENALELLVRRRLVEVLEPDNTGTTFNRGAHRGDLARSCLDVHEHFERPGRCSGQSHRSGPRPTHFFLRLDHPDLVDSGQAAETLPPARWRSESETRADGLELIERMSAGQWAVSWVRGGDDRWPCFLEERQAISWMRDRLSRGRVFA